MRKLFCHILRRHHPTLVVVGFADDHAVTAPICPRCGRPAAHHDYA